jgi:hypothetical protein
MATDKPTGRPGDKPVTDKPDERTAADKSAQKADDTASRREAASGQTQSPTTGVKEELRASHERRTTVPGAPNIDARLDNRSGANRPKLETFPAKPQHIDGPDVMHQVEHTRRTLDMDALGKDASEVERKGMFSPGPHGLSDESLREGETTFGTEGLTESEAAKGSPKAG